MSANIINFDEAKKSLEKKKKQDGSKHPVKRVVETKAFKRRPYFLYLYNGSLYIGYEGQHIDTHYNLLKAISVNVSLENDSLQIIPSQIYPYHLLVGDREIFVPSLNIVRSQVMLAGPLNENMSEFFFDIIGDTDKNDLEEENRIRECLERQDFAKKILEITEKKMKNAKILPFEKPLRE